MGIYPLAVLAQGSDLVGGLERLRGLGLVSVALVPDPFASPSTEALSQAFDHVRPFKPHLIVDPTAGPYSPSRHHGQRIRRGYRRCDVQNGPLRPWLGDWCRLYRGLTGHRGITGVAAFPDASFEAMADLRAMVAFAARVDEQIVGMALWLAHDGVVYNHLAAFDAVGYANGVSYALYDSAIRHFEGQGVINLGGGAGTGAGEGGLAEFKHGFANSEVRTVLCGAVLDPVRYEALSKGRAGPFFPAYRGPS